VAVVRHVHREMVTALSGRSAPYAPGNAVEYVILDVEINLFNLELDAVYETVWKGDFCTSLCVLQ
jgi:hypothetical protein